MLVDAWLLEVPLVAATLADAPAVVLIAVVLVAVVLVEASTDAALAVDSVGELTIVDAEVVEMGLAVGRAETTGMNPEMEDTVDDAALNVIVTVSVVDTMVEV